MTRAELCRDRSVFRQRQNTARRMNHAVANDHGAVVQRRLIEENIAHNLAGRLAVNLRASLNDVAKLRFALEYDKRAHFELL